MLEILLIALMFQRVRLAAKARNLPAGWIALVLLIPVAGIVVGVGAVIALLVAGIADSQSATLYALPFYLVAEIGTAVLIDRYMKKKPAAVAQRSDTSDVVGDSYAQAGHCSDCGRNVYLAPDGSCQLGHPASSVSGVYYAPRADPSPPNGA
jgi:hypothetical protein